MAQPRCAVETELATDEAESHVVRHNNFFSDRLLERRKEFSTLVEKLLAVWVQQKHHAMSPHRVKKQEVIV